MKKIYFLLTALVMTMGLNAQTRAAGDVVYYDGKLNVVMESIPIATDKPVKVSLTENAGGSFTFLLPKFEILEIPCGDIVVENVSYADADGDGVFELAGKVEDLSLAEGQIHARVTLTGTEDGKGAINLNIAVDWYQGYPDDMELTTPISVTFAGQREQAGINDAAVAGAVCYGVDGAVVVDGFSGKAEVYSLLGKKVAEVAVAGKAEVAVAKGVYVVRLNGKAVKVVVR